MSSASCKRTRTRSSQVPHSGPASGAQRTIGGIAITEKPDIEPSEPPPRGFFPGTRASVIERLREPQPERRRAAFGVLAEAYGAPVYAYLRRRWRLDAEDARDVAQNFFATAFEKQWFERYDPTVARFRTFVRTCLDRHVMNWRQGEQRLKRGGHIEFVSLDLEATERGVGTLPPASPDAADRVFHDEFVRTLFARAVDAVRSACGQSGHATQFALFERHDLAVDSRPSYAELAEGAGLSVSQVTNQLAMVRRRFRDAVIATLRELAGSDEEFREDVRALLGIEADA